VSFVWPHEPTAGAKSSDFADYAELLCLRDGSCSVTRLSRDLGRIEENDYEGGVEEYSELDEDIELGFKEIERRLSACGADCYPFSVTSTGHRIDLADDITSARVLYCYLLLATRLNMASDRNQADIDGTLLFEHVSAQIAAALWGERSQSMVFGTGAHQGGFETKVNLLCSGLGEGGGFKNRNEGVVTQNDGKLDVVVWKGFRDGRVGKLIGFGQCKTGRNWRDSLTQLQVDAFVRSWMQDAPPVDPIRLFFVSEVVGEELWYSQVASAGLLLDRCRIVDYSPGEMPAEVMDRVRAWTLAALTSNDLTHAVGIL